MQQQAQLRPAPILTLQTFSLPTGSVILKKGPVWGLFTSGATVCSTVQTQAYDGMACLLALSQLSGISLLS